jgi:glutaredoxin
MKNKIVLYTLQGCTICDKLKKELSHIKIAYKEISCSLETDIRDKLENMTNCNLYPMCMIESYPNKKILMCIAKDINQLNSIKTLNGNNILTYVHSIDNMLTVIKNI